METSRIPVRKSTSTRSMSLWFSKMAARDLLFHPDDDPADIIRVSDGEPLFATEEINKLRPLLDRMFAEHGDRVYDIAYPIFMRQFQRPIDS